MAYSLQHYDLALAAIIVVIRLIGALTWIQIPFAKAA
jgi:hypothetical protein